jgi:hypothetical protein
MADNADPGAADKTFQHTRDNDAAELLIRLRRMAYEPKALFVHYKEEVTSKYRKVEKDDANKGAFAVLNRRDLDKN